MKYVLKETRVPPRGRMSTGDCATKGAACSSGSGTCQNTDCQGTNPPDLNCIVDGDGTVANNGKGCKCNDGYTDGAGLCTKSAPSKCSAITTTGITDSKQCAADGGVGCAFADGKCACAGGYVDTDAGCKSLTNCSAITPASKQDDCAVGGEGCTFNTDKCACADGYIDSAQGCLQKPADTPCTKNEYKNGTDCTNLAPNCANPTATDAKNCVCKSGFEAQNDGTCKASSSASPLAIALICALVLSIAASIATAAVVIRRKALERRGAEDLVSDAL